MEMLTESEAAVITQLHPRTLRKRLEQGLIKGSNFGTLKKACWRIHPDDLRGVQPQAAESKSERVRRPRTTTAPQVHAPAWPPPRAA